MRIWPKTACLICIALWFAFVHADPSGPLGEVETERLRGRLDAYYSIGQPHSGRFRVLEADRYASLAAVPHLLAAVLAHPDGESLAWRRRNVLVLSWAAHLAMSEGPRLDLDFIRARMQRQLGALLARYPEPGDARLSIVMMFDRLQLWSTDQLPFLAFEAGSPDDYAAERATLIARQIMPDDEPAATAELARVIRAQPHRTMGQWALLAQSGHVRDDELGLLLMLVAHEFAGADVPFEIASLQHQNPLRDVLEDLMTQYRRGDEVADSAFLMAKDLSDASLDFDTPMKIRHTFFEHFAAGTLLDPHPTEAWRDVMPANDLFAVKAPAESDAGAPRAATSAVSRRDGDVLHVDFGRSCADRLTKP